MPFSETIKKKVQEKAAFRCCRCQGISVEVHHIHPEEHGGPSTERNAAPLCPNCHTLFGDNMKKRKEITRMRDWWYKRVEDMYPDRPDLLNRINTKLQDIEVSQSSAMNELKNILKSVADDMIDRITPETARMAASGIVNASSAASSVKLGDNVYANFICRNCNTRIGLLVGKNRCPNCGTRIM